MRETALLVPISEQVQGYAIRLVMATQPTTEYGHPLTKKYLPYRDQRPPGPLLRLDVERALHWSALEAGG